MGIVVLAGLTAVGVANLAVLVSVRLGTPTCVFAPSLWSDEPQPRSTQARTVRADRADGAEVRVSSWCTVWTDARDARSLANGMRPSISVAPSGLAGSVYQACGRRGWWARLLNLVIRVPLWSEYLQTTVSEEIDGEVLYRFDRQGD